MSSIERYFGFLGLLCCFNGWGTTPSCKIIIEDLAANPATVQEATDLRLAIEAEEQFIMAQQSREEEIARLTGPEGGLGSWYWPNQNNRLLVALQKESEAHKLELRRIQKHRDKKLAQAMVTWLTHQGAPFRGNHWQQLEQRLAILAVRTDTLELIYPTAQFFSSSAIRRYAQQLQQECEDLGNHLMDLAQKFEQFDKSPHEESKMFAYILRLTATRFLRRPLPPDFFYSGYEALLDNVQNVRRILGTLFPVKES